MKTFINSQTQRFPLWRRSTVLPSRIRKWGSSSHANGPATRCLEVAASESDTCRAQKPFCCHPGQQHRKKVGIKEVGSRALGLSGSRRGKGGAWSHVEGRREGRGPSVRLLCRTQRQALWDRGPISGVGSPVIFCSLGKVLVWLMEILPNSNYY